MSAILRAEIRPYGFSPTTGWDDEQRAKYPIGTIVHLSILKGRSPKMHRFYWALIDHVAGAIGRERYEFSNALLVDTRRINAFESREGVLYIVPKSISKMEHVEFKEYVDAAIELICKAYIAAMTAGQLLSEVEKMLNISYAEAFAPPNKKEKNNGVQ